MSVQKLTNIAVNYSRTMDTTAAMAADPSIASDPGKMAIFQMNLENAKTGYTMSVRAIQDIHQQDQLLNELLRDS